MELQKANKMSIAINGVTKQETAYDKSITFTFEDKEYLVLLHWDCYDGYDLTFLDVKEPEWAIDWDEQESLESYLDGLSDDVVEEGN